MSAASTPAPNFKRLSKSGRSPSRHSLFLPILIFLLGAGSLALYQVMAMEDQLDQLTQAVDKMSDKVKRGQHEKTMFYHIAKDVLNLSPKDPNAEQITVYFKLRQLQAQLPELMDVNTPADVAVPNMPPASTPASTNAPAATPPPATKAESLDSTAPAPK
jgi:hypothetical protein